MTSDPCRDDEQGGEHEDLEAAPDQGDLPRPQPRPLDRVVIGDVAAVGQDHNKNILVIEIEKSIC